MVEYDTLEKWLETYDYERPRRGEIRKGVLLEVDHYGAVVDVGFKHDGIVPPEDLERLEEEVVSDLEPGQEITARVMQPRDQEGDLMLSMFQVRTEKDWTEAQKMMADKEIVEAEVTGHNKGGLLVKFRHLEGFVPASHTVSMWRKSNLSKNERKATLKEYVGKEIPLQFIEVDRHDERLILSERLAREELREKNMEQLLEELSEGDVRQGVVRHLTDFGAFVDIGGADGLVHISELAWRRVRHPSEVVQVGDKIEVYVLELDHKRQRINLSLKRLKPDPWAQVDMLYTADQLVSGRVTNVVNYGAFILLDVGVEGLLHVSEIADPVPDDPREFLERGEELVVRILSIDSTRQRISLSLKRVSDQERAEWLNKKQKAADETAEAADETAEAADQAAETENADI